MVGARSAGVRGRRGSAVVNDEDLLVAVLNSTPLVAAGRQEQLEGAAGERLAQGFGGTGSEEELKHLRRVRDVLQDVIGGGVGAEGELQVLMAPAFLAPLVTGDGIRWELQAPSERRLAARTVVAWSEVVQHMPGRLRACANAECTLYLVDHSRPGTARWCSMAVCGNRTKARNYARRQRT